MKTVVMPTGFNIRLFKKGVFMMAKKTVDDIQVNGKRVLVRCDFNVPMKEGKIPASRRTASSSLR